MPIDFAYTRRDQSIDAACAAFQQHMHMVRVLQAIPHHEITGSSRDTPLWRTLAGRLAWAMKCQGLDPRCHQSELARRVGNNCKPQNIQYLLNPRSNARASKYIENIASTLRCDSDWLRTGVGPHPAQPASHDVELPAAPAFRGRATQSSPRTLYKPDNEGATGRNYLNMTLTHEQHYLVELVKALDRACANPEAPDMAAAAVVIKLIAALEVVQDIPNEAMEALSQRFRYAALASMAALFAETLAAVHA